MKQIKRGKVLAVNVSSSSVRSRAGMRALVRRGEARAGIKVRCQGADAGVARTAVPGGEEWCVRRQADEQGPLRSSAT